MDDNQIVDLYLARDERAISETSAQYGRGLFTLSKRVVGDEGTAEECVNDTYMKAWNTIPPNEPRTFLFAFLARIVRFTSIDVYKKTKSKKRQAQIVSLTAELDMCVGGPDNTSEAIDEMLLTESINRFLGGLPTEKRKVFVRRYWYSDEIREIAGHYGYSVSKVKMMLSRMREDLGRHLHSDGLW